MSVRIYVCMKIYLYGGTWFVANLAKMILILHQPDALRDQGLL